MFYKIYRSLSLDQHFERPWLPNFHAKPGDGTGRRAPNEATMFQGLGCYGTLLNKMDVCLMYVPNIHNRGHILC